MEQTATERRDRRRRYTLMVGIVTFLFHSLFPYYVTASSADVEGYTTTICSIYGNQTVFVPLGDGSPASDADPSIYYDCPSCLVHANANGWLETCSPLLEASLPQIGKLWNRQLSLTPEGQHYPPFLIRGPPA